MNQSVLHTFLVLLLAIGVRCQERSIAGGQRKFRRNQLPAGRSRIVDFRCPEDFGYYAHPSDCTQYYVCVFGGALQESCTGGLMYSNRLQTCDWPRNSGCTLSPSQGISTKEITDPRTSPRVTNAINAATEAFPSSASIRRGIDNAIHTRDDVKSVNVKSRFDTNSKARQGRFLTGQGLEGQDLNTGFQAQETSSRTFNVVPGTKARSTFSSSVGSIAPKQTNKAVDYDYYYDDIYDDYFDPVVEPKPVVSRTPSRSTSRSRTQRTQSVQQTPTSSRRNPPTSISSTSFSAAPLSSSRASSVRRGSSSLSGTRIAPRSQKKASSRLTNAHQPSASNKTDNPTDSGTDSRSQRLSKPREPLLHSRAPASTRFMPPRNLFSDRSSPGDLPKDLKKNQIPKTEEPSDTSSRKEKHSLPPKKDQDSQKGSSPKSHPRLKPTLVLPQSSPTLVNNDKDISTRTDAKIKRILDQKSRRHGPFPISTITVSLLKNREERKESDSIPKSLSSISSRIPLLIPFTVRSFAPPSRRNKGTKSVLKPEVVRLKLHESPTEVSSDRESRRDSKPVLLLKKPLSKSKQTPTENRPTSKARTPISSSSLPPPPSTPKTQTPPPPPTPPTTITTTAKPQSSSFLAIPTNIGQSNLLSRLPASTSPITRSNLTENQAKGRKLTKTQPSKISSNPSSTKSVLTTLRSPNPKKPKHNVEKQPKKPKHITQSTRKTPVITAHKPSQTGPTHKNKASHRKFTGVNKKTTRLANPGTTPRPNTFLDTSTTLKTTTTSPKVKATSTTTIPTRARAQSRSFISRLLKERPSSIIKPKGRTKSTDTEARSKALSRGFQSPSERNHKTQKKKAKEESATHKTPMREKIIKIPTRRLHSNTRSRPHPISQRNFRPSRPRNLSPSTKVKETTTVLPSVTTAKSKIIKLNVSTRNTPSKLRPVKRLGSSRPSTKPHSLTNPPTSPDTPPPSTPISILSDRRSRLKLAQSRISHRNKPKHPSTPLSTEESNSQKLIPSSSQAIPNSSRSRAPPSKSKPSLPSVNRPRRPPTLTAGKSISSATTSRSRNSDPITEKISNKHPISTLTVAHLRNTNSDLLLETNNITRVTARKTTSKDVIKSTPRLPTIRTSSISKTSSSKPRSETGEESSSSKSKSQASQGGSPRLFGKTPTRVKLPSLSKMPKPKRRKEPVIDIWKYPPRRPAPTRAQPPVGSVASICNRKVCNIPDCYCGGGPIPGGLSPETVPQLVLLTFDDSINDLNKKLYEELFERGRTNPNGCPIASTMYVSHEWTDYSQVQNLYADGHEIASHSITHSFGEQFSTKKWAQEIHGMREILSAYGGVRMEDVRGMRAPFLAIGGNRMFEMLYDLNFTYDSSMPVYNNNPPSWPYTLDYKVFHDCMIPPCPTKSYPGVWEVPMVMWQDLVGGRCSMGDACTTPADANGVYDMLIKNFERHYTTNRAPFGLYYHAAWFTKKHHKEGFIAFLDAITALDDVWLVTNWQALQYVRNPVTIDQAKTFKPFQCDYPERPPRCSSPKVCNVWHKGSARYMKTCQACPASYPWTGKTGVPSSLNLV